ncbi:hypothetical protein BU14_0279s0010 [Porphyra umbilicalis]|uniref:Uncharacterized protein n=1 Tax=Porphyra umbilicalis TaxID=2786 RepID=A0A1X6P184_PORUM|nr:hypothetical protein BU14_0279s0010 [Porphyra umbilicalis]|eukprot:OSX74624.1 hypothetical protein BU14_0279s0010 [Porphyra umbilicalis]
MDTPVADEAFVALLAGMRPRRMGVADVQALPEMAILRRSPLAARWMAPMSPFLSAEAAAAATHAAVGVADVDGAGGGMFPGLTPDALAAATPLDSVLRRLQLDTDATGSATSNGGTSSSSGCGGSGGGYPCADTPVLLVSSMSVPIHTDGTVIVGYTISDVHVDAVTPAFLRSDPYPRICRFAMDTHTLQGLEMCSRHDGRVVLFNSLRQAGLPLEHLQWIMSAFTRPPAGVSAASGPPFTTLHARKSTLCHRTEAVNAAASRLLRGGNGPERVLDDFRALHDCLGSFGGAAVADDGADGDGGGEGGAPTTAASYAPGALVTVPPAAAGGSGGARPRLPAAAAAAAAPVRMVSSVFSCTRSGVVGAERLRMLALSLQAVNPLRLRLRTGPAALEGALGAAPSAPASASGGGVAASTTPPWLPRQRPIAPAPRLSPPAPRPSPPAAAAAASASTSGDSAAGAAGAAGATGAAGAGAPAAACLGPARRRPRRKVTLADVTDAAAAARILRNRSAAARSNAKRKAARLGALAAAAVVAVPPLPPPLPPPPTVGAVSVPLAVAAPASAAAPLDGGGDGRAPNPLPP